MISEVLKKEPLIQRINHLIDQFDNDPDINVQPLKPLAEFSKCLPDNDNWYDFKYSASGVYGIGLYQKDDPFVPEIHESTPYSPSNSTLLRVFGDYFEKNKEHIKFLGFYWTLKTEKDNRATAQVIVQYSAAIDGKIYPYVEYTSNLYILTDGKEVYELLQKNMQGLDKLLGVPGLFGFLENQNV